MWFTKVLNIWAWENFKAKLKRVIQTELAMTGFQSFLQSTSKSNIITGRSIHLSLCDQHPLELCRAQPQRLVQRPWAFHLPQWKPLHSYHIHRDLVCFFWLQVQQSCVGTKLCLWQHCLLKVNFPDLLSFQHLS